jgi:hypothetical protein
VPAASWKRTLAANPVGVVGGTVTEAGAEAGEALPEASTATTT